MCKRKLCPCVVNNHLAQRLEQSFSFQHKKKQVQEEEHDVGMLMLYMPLKMLKDH